MADWIVTLPYRRPPLSGNSRYGSHYQERRVQHEIANDLWKLAKHHKIPQLGAVIIELAWYKGNNRRADSDNLGPCLKPMIDGLVKAKVLVDDDASRVLQARQRVIYRRDDPYDSGTPRMVLAITDASELAPLPHYAPEEVTR